MRTLEQRKEIVYRMVNYIASRRPNDVVEQRLAAHVSGEISALRHIDRVKARVRSIVRSEGR